MGDGGLCCFISTCHLTPNTRWLCFGSRHFDEGRGIEYTERDRRACLGCPCGTVFENEGRAIGNGGGFVGSCSDERDVASLVALAESGHGGDGCGSGCAVGYGVGVGRRGDGDGGRSGCHASCRGYGRGGRSTDERLKVKVV